MNAKLYPINGYAGDFVTGMTGDGRQAILGMNTYLELIGFFFDEGGFLTGVEHRRLPPEYQIVAANPYDAAEVRKTELAIGIWEQELGFKRAIIRVRSFSEDGVRIEALPSHFEEFLKNPRAVEPDERLRARLQNEIDHWRREGMFVFWWGKDYWMDADGNVDST